MSLTFITKTYVHDVPWLQLSIKTVLRFCRCPFEWHIIADSTAYDPTHHAIDEEMKLRSRDDAIFKVYLTKEIWPECLKMSSGYHAQQWVKMTAHRVIGTSTAWNIDSDVCFMRDFSEVDLSPSSKPILWISHYNDIWSQQYDNAFRVRREFQKQLFKIPEITMEFMRCMPIILNGGLLAQGESTSIWKRSYDAIMASNHAFSEFNVIGQFALLYFPDLFDWRNAELEGPTFGGGTTPLISQKWSYGGIDDAYRLHIATLCGG